MSGHIRDFNKPNPDADKGPQVLSAVSGKQGPQVSQEPTPVEVKIHEEVIEEGQDSIRQAPPDESGIEIRIRGPRDPQSWENARRGKDD